MRNDLASLKSACVRLIVARAPLYGRIVLDLSWGYGNRKRHATEHETRAIGVGASTRETKRIRSLRIVGLSEEYGTVIIERQSSSEDINIMNGARRGGEVPLQTRDAATPDYWMQALLVIFIRLSAHPGTSIYSGAIIMSNRFEHVSPPLYGSQGRVAGRSCQAI